MFRKHFRIKRTVLGLAFATMIIPVAPAGAVSLSTFVDGGPAPVSNASIASYQPSYLRYHEVGVPVATGPQIRSEHSVTAATITPRQADGMRWTAMAKAYERLQPTVAISERSNGALATSNGFDWTDAGVGASTAFAAVLLLGIGILFTRRHQGTGLTSA